MKRRYNISEELELNKDITLDNGEDKKDEEEKVANELEELAQKDIDEKHKMLDEIRDAKAPKAEINDGFGKSLKIKQFVEKLTLDESSNILNENDNDGYIDYTDNAKLMPLMSKLLIKEVEADKISKEDLKYADGIGLHGYSDYIPVFVKKSDNNWEYVYKDFLSYKNYASTIGSENPKYTSDGVLNKLKNLWGDDDMLLVKNKTSMNEDFNDFLFEKRSDAVHAVYDVLESYVDILMTTDVDILDACETVCEEALVHLEDAIDSGEF